MKRTYIQPTTNVIFIRPTSVIATSLGYSNAQGTTGNVDSRCNDAKSEGEDFGW